MDVIFVICTILIKNNILCCTIPSYTTVLLRKCPDTKLFLPVPYDGIAPGSQMKLTTTLIHK